ncbi:MAG: glycerol-3-phosphate dehydrogenase (NAD(P)+) [Myxococcota bacterium]|jgi:glycerol-3-phosphate dehydrogenase (NAD(P)+)
MKCAVIGAGAWGTALATVLVEAGHDTVIWAFEPEVAATIRGEQSNPIYLPDIALPAALDATSDLSEAVRGRELILSVVPAQHTRRVTEQWAAHALPDAIVVTASKGIELGSGKLLNDVFAEVLQPGQVARLAYLSGPSFAREVATGKPTVVVCAAADESVAETVQHAFARPTFRTYRSTDVVGVEVGGALKNVIAIATGMCDGMGLGHNARAAVITRGLVELTRMAVKLGADPITMMGLAGMGDLVLTCTGDLSRNRTFGKALGQGNTVEQLLGKKPQVVEGVATAWAAHELARKLGVSTPIIDEVYAILYEGADVRGAVERLMTRSLKREQV